MNHGSFAIEDALLTQILEAAEKAYPFECCGILMGSDDGAVKEIKEVRNVVSGEKQRVGFSIDPLELYRCETEAKKRNVQIVGFYHSHPDAPARLSNEDIKGMIPDMTYVVVSALNGKRSEVNAYKIKTCDKRRQTCQFT